MGDTQATERTSSSVFLGAAEDPLLQTLQRRLAALVQLPLELVQRSEDLQVVHYTPQQSFGMHHDSSAFQPRLLTAFYYLSDVEEGGETLFPAADGAMAADEALRSAARAERCISSRQRRSPPPLAPLGPALLAPGGAPHPGGFWGLRGL